MKTATISEAKNKLSELLAEVRAGESLTILDRKRPIARVEAIREASSGRYTTAPEEPWAPDEIVALPLAEPSVAEAGMSDAVAEERESGW